MDPEIQALIDKGIAAGLGDDDIRGLVEEHRSRQSPRDRVLGMVGQMDQRGAELRRDTAEHPFQTAAEIAAAAPGVLSLARPAVPGVLSMASKAGAYVNSPAGRRMLRRLAGKALEGTAIGAGVKAAGLFD
jgi:hypothetical protein